MSPQVYTWLLFAIPVVIVAIGAFAYFVAGRHDRTRKTDEDDAR